MSQISFQEVACRCQGRVAIGASAASVAVNALIGRVSQALGRAGPNGLAPLVWGRGPGGILADHAARRAHLVRRDSGSRRAAHRRLVPAALFGGDPRHEVSWCSPRLGGLDICLGEVLADEQQRAPKLAGQSVGEAVAKVQGCGMNALAPPRIGLCDLRRASS